MVSVEKFFRVDQQWNVNRKSKCTTEFNFKYLDKITSLIIFAYTDSGQEETWCPQHVPNKIFSFPGFHTTTGSKRVSRFLWGILVSLLKLPLSLLPQNGSPYHHNSAWKIIVMSIPVKVVTKRSPRNPSSPDYNHMVWWAVRQLTFGWVLVFPLILPWFIFWSALNPILYNLPFTYLVICLPLSSKRKSPEERIFFFFLICSITLRYKQFLTYRNSIHI